MINNIIKSKFFQPRNNNRATLKYLKKLGYPIPHIRKALIVLNGVKLDDIAQGQSTPSSISKTLRLKTGRNHRKKDKSLIASKLNLEIEELF